MAQIGRIGGLLLEENLVRNGVDIAVRNNTSTTQLLYIDVNNRRIGINLNNPSYELETFGTTRTVNLITDDLVFPSLRIEDNEINAIVGNINLNAADAIVLTNLETAEFTISNNRISTIRSNADIDLIPNGTGIVDIYNDLKILGNLQATGNITLDGTITFGDNISQDTVEFNADINSNIIPDQTLTYSLGNATKRWDELYTDLLNGEAITVSSVGIGGTNLALRQGNIFYVAVNGSDTNVGDHPQGPFGSIRRALAAADASNGGPVTVFVFPGEYQEQLPLVIPSNVSIIGEDFRNTIVVPDTGSQSEDVFHMNGETTIQNMTVKNFYYDSINNTGYAFRFAPNAVISTRSPYVQNVSVITKGSTTSVSDPRGFDAGDAGRGAYIDGAELSSASFDASMLFHSVTMITPGVDAVTMTNGVRVEWLNSFTYFANRGLYAVRGITGRISQDGSTVAYGAEIRSIGSANVYGNIGAEADGAGTLMYLILHNFGYIGSGKELSNDKTLAIQTNEVVELNSGKIYYSSTDHLGNFRVGNNFFIDFETGSTTVDLSSLTANSLNGLVITTGAGRTFITAEKIETGNIQFAGNTLLTVSGDINIDADTGEINLNNDTTISDNLEITGNLTFGGNLNLFGDQDSDTLKFNVDFDQNLNPNIDSTFTLGTPLKRWSSILLPRTTLGLESTFGDIIFKDNYITTTTSNSDLEFRASGTGNILFASKTRILNNLIVSGAFTADTGIDIIGNLTLTGETVQQGSMVVTGSMLVNENVIINQAATLEEILIDDNFITTTSSNADLELQASGVGNVSIPNNNVEILNNLSTFSAITDLNYAVSLQTTASTINISSIKIQDNFITSTVSNANLEIRASNNSLITFKNNSLFNNNLEVNGISSLKDLNIVGDIAHSGLRIVSGNYNLGGELIVDNIFVKDNFISTIDSTSSLELTANSSGKVIFENDLKLSQSLSVNSTSFFQQTSLTGNLTQVGNRISTGNFNHDGNLLIAGQFTADRKIQFENISVETNILETTISNADFELRANGVGNVLIPNNDVRIANNLLVSNIIVGNVNIDADVVLNKIIIPPSIIEIDDNFISTRVSNADLDIRATGDVIIPANDLIIQQALTTNGNTVIRNVEIIGGKIHTGNRSQTGNVSISGNLSLGNITTDSLLQFENIRIAGNTVSTTITNSNLELRANGVGRVIFDNTSISQNLQTGTLDVSKITIANSLASKELELSTDIRFFDNVITTTNSNSNLELRASGNVYLQDLEITESTIQTATAAITFSVNDNLIISSNGSLQLPAGTTLQRNNIIGDIRFNTIDSVFEGTASGVVTFGGIYSSNRRSNVLAHPTNNTIGLTINTVSIGAITATELTIPRLDVDAIQINNNTISAATLNSNLEFRTTGTGQLTIDNLSIIESTINNNDIALTFNSTGFGYYKISGTYGLVVPAGTTAERPSIAPPVGDTRWNTTTEVLETWDGSQYVLSVGASAGVSEAEYDNLLTEYTLIFG